MKVILLISPPTSHQQTIPSLACKIEKPKRMKELCENDDISVVRAIFFSHHIETELKIAEFKTLMPTTELKRLPSFRRGRRNYEVKINKDTFISK